MRTRMWLCVAGCLALAIALAPSAAAANCGYPYTIEDATGTNVTIHDEPETVVAAGSSAAQTVWEIGGEEKVVGIFKPWSLYLDNASAKTNVYTGNPTDPIAMEILLDLSPDLVIAANTVPNSSVEDVRAQGIPAVRFGKSADLDFIYRKTGQIGALTGYCDGAAATIDAMQRDVDTIEQTVSGNDGPRVFHMLYYPGIYTSGRGTFHHSVLEKVNAKNIAAEAGITWYKPMAEEEVVAHDPQWIITSEGVDVPDNDAFNSTTAVQKGQVIELTGPEFAQPAPRLVDGMKRLARAFYPAEYRAVIEEKQGSGVGARDQTTRVNVPRGEGQTTRLRGAANGRQTVRFVGETSSVNVSLPGTLEGNLTGLPLGHDRLTAIAPPGRTVTAWRLELETNASDVDANLSFAVPSDTVASEDVPVPALGIHHHRSPGWTSVASNVTTTDGTVRVDGRVENFSVFTVAATADPTAAVELTDDPVSVGETVRLDGRGSTDPYGTIEGYVWEIDGERYVGSTANVSFDEPGDHDVTLTVTNRAGRNGTATRTVTVEAVETGSNPTDEGGAENDTEDSDGASENVPGFTAVVALVAMLAAVALRGRAA